MCQRQSCNASFTETFEDFARLCEAAVDGAADQSREIVQIGRDAKRCTFELRDIPIRAHHHRQPT